jgi:hypothetical protein
MSLSTLSPLTKTLFCSDLTCMSLNDVLLHSVTFQLYMGLDVTLPSINYLQKYIDVATPVSRKPALCTVCLLTHLE